MISLTQMVDNTMEEIAEQSRLRNAKVLVVGAGGLGCGALYSLAGAGVGNIGIMDPDTVSLSNLNRQYLYTPEQSGQHKALCAAERLRAFNPSITITPYLTTLTEENSAEFIPGYDIVVDCVDNLETRHLVSRQVMLHDKQAVEAGISGWKGYVFVVRRFSPCFGCVHPDSGKTKAPVPSPCAVSSAVGALEAAECIKLILGIGIPLCGQALVMDFLTMKIRQVRTERDPACPNHIL